MEETKARLEQVRNLLRELVEGEQEMRTEWFIGKEFAYEIYLMARRMDEIIDESKDFMESRPEVTVTSGPPKHSPPVIGTN